MTSGGRLDASLDEAVNDAVATVGEVVRDFGCGRNSCRAAVLLNETVQHVPPDDSPANGSLHRVLDVCGDLLPDPLVRALRVEVRDELPEDPPKVALADHDEMLQDLSPYGAKKRSA
jgi:hypothetical protein